MILTQQFLKNILQYDQKTGHFLWLKCARLGLSGTRAGSKDKKGYIQIQIHGRIYKAHRLAWLWMRGELPAAHVDHRNMDTGDNRWVNIRSVSKKVNQQNIRRPKTNNKSGFLGVIKKRSRWRAAITIDGKGKYLGTFDTPEQAHKAYLSAKRKFHPGNTL